MCIMKYIAILYIYVYIQYFIWQFNTYLLSIKNTKHP